MSDVSHITIVGHNVVNQCTITWKSKRPTCNVESHVMLKSHVNQTVMREVEQSQGSVSPLAIDTPHLYMKRNFHLCSSHIGLRVCNILF